MIACVVIIGTLLALVATPSFASVLHRLTTSFGAFNNPQSVATDTSGNVYVLDVGAGTVSKFDSSGNPVEFAPLAGNTIGGFSFDSPSAAQVAVDNSGGVAGGDIYVASFGGVDVYGADGSHLGNLDGSGNPNPDSGGEACGVATDPAGNVYVGYFSGHVDRYTPAANPVVNGDFDAEISGLGGICNVAADSSGAVYASTYSTGPLTKFAASEFGGVGVGTIVSGDSRAVGIDPSTDDVYVARQSDIAQFDSAGNLLEGFGAGDVSAPLGVAVDQSDDVFASNSAAGTVSVFAPVVLPDVTTGTADTVTGSSATLHGTVNPTGVAVSDCHFEYGPTPTYGHTLPCAESVGSGSADVPVHGDTTGLDPGTAYHFRLVASNANGTVTGGDNTFLTPGPQVSDIAVSQITPTSARLSARINPNGEPTSYRFEYGSQGPCDSNPCTSIPVPDASAGEGSSQTLVTEVASGLSPATGYHFRLVASNASGTNASQDSAFTTYAPTPAFAACPNDGLRSGQGPGLPDCRAYEQASPVDKNGAEAQGESGGQRADVRAAVAGGAITFLSTSGIPGGVGSQSVPIYLARRGTEDWSTQGLLPPPSYGQSAVFAGWTSDLSQVFLDASFLGPPSTTAFVSRSSTDGTLTLISPYKASGQSRLAATSVDGSKVFFENQGAQLTPEAPAKKPNLYVWDRATGTLALAGVLPSSACGSPPCIPSGGSVAGSYDWFATGTLTPGEGSGASYVADQHAVSADGDKAFFTDGDAEQVYLREGLAGSSPSTVQVSASDRQTPDPNGQKPAAFMTATPDGSKAFFTSCAKLTDDSTAFSTSEDTCTTASQGQDLYLYDTSSGEVHDLTVDTSASDSHGADVKGVLGISDDGSYVYFVANGDLDGPGGPATPGDCQGGASHTGGLTSSGSCSLYVWHAGSIAFVARLSANGAIGDTADWEPFNAGSEHGARVSADGRTLLFASSARLTPYDNSAPSCKGPCSELYRYTANDGQISCVSCNPTGAAPTGPASLMSIHSPVQIGAETSGFEFETRNLSSDGNRVFFETPDKLVPADTNGDNGCPRSTKNNSYSKCLDVYEWEADGAGSCHSSAADEGCLYLLSRGVGSDASFFADASASGDDVFIFTQDQLVPQDTDQLGDVYDVRVDGGLASQHRASPAPCSGDACQVSPTGAPAGPVAASVTFVGPGNAAAGSAPAHVSVPPHVLTKAVRGTSFVVRVSVSGAGGITISGNGVSAVERSVSRAGTYQLRLTLTAKARRALSHARRLKSAKRMLKLTLHVRYAPAVGRASTATIGLMVRPVRQPGEKALRRATSNNRGGAQ